MGSLLKKDWSWIRIIESVIRKIIRINIITIVELGLLLMVEKEIRGGICQVSHRHVKVNNKYMNHYDKKIDSSYIAHLDANNLYGWAMS